ncbi:MAG TPA: GMC family oxidoreductase [Stellaceae bacterium]|nr:GMC family oxidoreductase [Stellaceae bacterium]
MPDGTTIDADICIVGAGAAGITLALDLADGKRRVAVLESGGFDFDQATQDLYRGQVVGREFTPLDADRLRYLGGTTNHWSGSCRPFDEIDLEPRTYVPNSGWPFGRATLDPFYRRAQEICQLGPFTYDPNEWTSPGAEPLKLEAGARILTGIYQTSPPTRFGEAYREKLTKADGVVVYLNANVVGIDTTENAQEVTRLCLASLDGRRFTARSKYYVLAAGGIENARLLLNANQMQAMGLGNRFDLVGRYFMDHPIVTGAATVLFQKPNPALAFYEGVSVRGHNIAGYLYAPPDVLRAEELPAFSIGIHPGNPPSKDFTKLSLNAIWREIKTGRWPDDLGFYISRVLSGLEWEAKTTYEKMVHSAATLYSTICLFECAPNRDSRVMLDDTVDAFGMRRVKLDWRVSDSLGADVRRAHELFAQELGRADLGRLRMNMDEEEILRSVQNAHHHMGTTRMHRDAEQGVVDENCRLHDVENLFIAGSSVFPSYSFDDPTLTIVALALRLSSHLKQLSM